MILTHLIYEELKHQQYDLTGYEENDEITSEQLSKLKKKALPFPKENIDWNRVIEVCQEHIENTYNKKIVNGIKEAIYEEVIAAIYGEDILNEFFE